MVTSLYITQYFEWLAAMFLTEGISFDKTLLYVPENSAESMMDYVVKNEIVKKTKSPGETVSYMGFNRGVVGKEQGRRQSEAVRFNTTTSTASSRKMIMGTIPLTTYIISNKPEIVEDLEETYQVMVRNISTITMNLTNIFEQDSPDFAVNCMNDEIGRSDPLPQKGFGNLWTLDFSTMLYVPLFSLSEEERGLATRLSINLYNNNYLIDQISQDSSGNPVT